MRRDSGADARSSVLAKYNASAGKPGADGSRHTDIGSWNDIEWMDIPVRSGYGLGSGADETGSARPGAAQEAEAPLSRPDLAL